MSDYVELRAHTCFSFSDGAISAEALAKHARQLGYTHLGITDTADLGGLAKFAVEAMSPLKDPTCPNAEQHDAEYCKTCQYPVRPLVGAELNVDGYPMAFLARNEEGYCNLAALVTLSPRLSAKSVLLSVSTIKPERLRSLQATTLSDLDADELHGWRGQAPRRREA